MTRLLFKRLSPAVLKAVVTAFLASSAFGQTAFTSGNVVVYRVGSGTGDLINTGNPVFVDEYSIGGTRAAPTASLVRSIALPTVAAGSNRRLIASGTASADGLMTRSADGRFLIVPGYEATIPNAVSLTGTASAAVRRVIGFISASGVVNTSTGLADVADLNNFRCVCSNTGSTFYAAGGAGGIRYISGTGSSISTSTQLNSTLLAFRQVAIFGNQLYASNSSGTVRMAVVGTGQPTTVSQTITALPGYPTSGANPAAFAFFDLNPSIAGVDTLYLADDGGTTGGVWKYSFDGTTWNSNGSVGAAADAYRGLSGRALGTTVTLFLTRKGGIAAVGGGELAMLVDTTGHNATITAAPALLATAAPNTAFRGVALAPQAIQPDLLVTSVMVPANATTNTTFSYTVRVGNIGTANATGVAARFTLPSGLNFVSATGTNGFSATQASGVVSFTGGSLNAGTVATLTINVSTATAATYTVAASAALMDPTASVTESNETNNGSTDTPSTIVSMPNTPPSFSIHPANVSVGNGATVTLTALSGGSPTPTYQWYQGTSGNTSSPISGATSASYTTAVLFLNQTYWVRATNAQGSADSTSATVTVAPSNNANLSALAVSSLLLEPTFDPLDLNYITIVANTVTSMTVTPTVAQSFATVTVNGTPVTSGGTSGSITLQQGPNLIAIAVTAQDGSTLRTYTVNVFRSAPALAAGSIAFVGFNADGDDDLAFVALRDIPNHSVIHFSDNEWNGSPLGGSGAFVDFLESEFAWIPPSGGIKAGNVVVINSLAVKASTTSSLGTVVFSDGNPGIGTTVESIYAFMGGTRVVGSFLAAISTDPALVLTGTGLTAGSTAVILAASSDGAVYKGARSGQVTYASYQTLIGNVATNWTDVLDGIGTTLLPLSTASFSLLGSSIYTHTNRDILNPNRDVWSGAGVTMNGLQFINLGIQGVGRIPSTQLDSTTGETVGSISDMAITGWTKNSNGTYTGSFNLLPDGGYRGSNTNPNYAARINSFNFTFTPYTAATATTAQNQIAMTFTGSSRFTYDHDGNVNTAPIFTTAMIPTGVGMLFGAETPIVTAVTRQSDGSIGNRVTLSTEGLVLDSRSGQDGKGWISDEYNPAILHFDSSKRIIGRLGVPEALVPHFPAGTANFGTVTPTNGRRENQGFEGLAQSPDGTRLFAMMQSASLQDSATGNEGRFNTRVLVYDISSSSTPATPIAQYVMQLPRIDDTAATTNGTVVSRTGAQSSIAALSNTALLVLARDGNGRGTVGPSPVFKSILMADLSNATNLGSTYNAEAAAPAPNGVLQAGITALSWTQALNMIGGLGSFTTEVSKFGLSISGGNGTTNTLSDKWEALSLVSCADAANPNDFFLFIGNDNNFLTTNGKVLTAAGSLATYNAGLAHDSMMLVYRVRIVAPGVKVTYQPTAQTLIHNAPAALSLGNGVIAEGMDRSFTVANTGTGQIDTLGVTIDGADAADFSVLTAPSAPLVSSGSTNFTIRLLSNSTGVKNATLHLTINASGSLSRFDIPVTATSNTALNAWRQTYFGTTDNSGQNALIADFDGDGLSNLLEYALDTVPNATTAGNGISVMPRGSIDQAASVLNGRLVLTFSTANTTRADVIYIIQCGSNPDDWTDIASKVGAAPWTWLAGGQSRIVTTINGGRTTVQVGDILPLSEHRRLMRLKVTIP